MSGDRGNTVRSDKARKKVWQIGIYIRLSKDDGRFFDESESVTNQRAIIEEHISKFDDGDEYIIVGEYVDDGISGTTDDERGGFQQMLSDIRRGRLNCVIVKDLARSFRNYSDQGYYLDDWFPRYNVRFISLYHQPLDSYRDPKTMRSIAVPIQGVLNENHCAETSEKVREVFDMKRRTGRHIGSFAAYGWMKDPNDKNSLLLDEEAAGVLNDIGDMILSGMSINSIVCYLNDHGILCPSAYKHAHGLKYANPKLSPGRKPLWSAVSIRRSMTDRMLCGDLVQGRYRIKSYKVHVQEKVPEDEWFIAENAIPPVMSREKFEKIQHALSRNTRTSPQQKQPYLFSGFLRCADCGKAMGRTMAKDIAYYHCRTYKSQSRSACTKHSIRGGDLEAAVLCTIREQIYLSVDYTEVIRAVDLAPQKKSRTKRLADTIAQKEKELERIAKYKQAIYQDWKDGELEYPEYRQMKADYEEQIISVSDTLCKLRKERHELEISVIEEKPFLKAFRQYQNIDCLNRELLLELVDHIRIYEGGRIKIRFRFADELREAQEFAAPDSSSTVV